MKRREKPFVTKYKRPSGFLFYTNKEKKMTVKGLLVMDVDSTLILEEGIDLLGEEAGVGSEVADITERAMRGELNFEEALVARVTLLKGLPVSVFDRILDKIHFTPGAEKLVAELHRRGYKVAVVSGGFHETVDVLAERLGIDYVKANRMEVEEGILTGRVLGDIVTKDTKKAYLEKWALENGVELAQTIAVGDGANDLPMIQTAGLGIAFCAKPIVQEQAPYRINEKNLAKVLELLDRRCE
ncbi:phosphoserine phosphatase SerB [Streptococcus cuniculi]|nr:phosphoserine phosphatase SerB [Streptococcus cuniculi]